MDRITTFAPSSQVPSTFLNSLQDRARSLMRPPGSTEITALTRVARAVINQFADTGNQVLAGDYRVIDQAANGFDWRDTIVEGWIATIGGVNDRLGGSAETFVNTYLRNAKRFSAYLGAGAKATLVFNRSAPDLDYFIEADWDGATNNFNVYADNTTGELRVANITGTDRGCIVMVECLAKYT